MLQFDLIECAADMLNVLQANIIRAGSNYVIVIDYGFKILL